MMNSETYDLLATATFGLEAVVARELNALGYETQITQSGRIHFSGDAFALAKANISLRCADRILLRIGEFDAEDFGELFDGVNALPWEKFIPANGEFPVRGRSYKSQLSSVPACQKIVKKAIVKRLQQAHGVEELPETGPKFTVEVALRNNVATLTIDTSGDGLNKRGYRPYAGPAPIKETLAAAMIQLSFYRWDKPLIDPFCGTGTIPIEAAMLARNIAPGLNRKYIAETWDCISEDVWQQVRDEARDAIRTEPIEKIIGTDISEDAIRLAKRNAEAAGVADDIHFQVKPFIELRSKKEYGCVITNPPYGKRLGADREISELYRTFPEVLRRLPTWSHYVITDRLDFEKILGQRANRRRKLFNGTIECTFYQYYGPKPGQPITKKDTVAAAEKSDAKPVVQNAPVFGGLKENAKAQSEMFANRLKKNAKHLRRWPKKGITCYRLYDKDIPEVPLAVDIYEDALHIAEYDRPHDRTPAEHADWLEMLARTAGKALNIDVRNVYLKRRQRQKGAEQYTRFADKGREMIVGEGGLRFKVNLSDYLDTGLFLDHRITRDMVRKEAAGKRFLNLFAYTGSFTVYAADGGASETTTADLSAKYLHWAEDNLELNGLSGKQHRMVCDDTMQFLADHAPTAQYDLAVVDPPTFSNSKALEHDFDIQKDHVELLLMLRKLMSPGGVVYFSNNFRKFKFDEEPLIEAGYEIREISKQTVPEDFRNKRIHRCWRMVVK